MLEIFITVIILILIPSIIRIIILKLYNHLESGINKKTLSTPKQFDFNTYKVALFIANLITYKKLREHIIKSIARKQLESELFDDALSTVNQIQYKTDRRSILKSIAMKQLDSGMFDDAISTANLITYKKF